MIDDVLFATVRDLVSAPYCGALEIVGFIIIFLANYYY